MFKKAQYIALAAVVLVTVIVLNLPARYSVSLKHAIGSLFTPLFGLAASGKQFADKTVDAMVPRSELLQRNETLSRENQELRVQLLKSEQVARENAALRDLLGWQKQTTWRLKLANVVLREPANWWRTVQIDLGSRDGMRENLPVLTADGLVGRISSVSYAHSQVTLVGDPACKVSAVVENPGHDSGIILGGASTLDTSLVTLSYLSHNATVNPGQGVVTSGLGEIFPRGIPVGTIVDSRPVEAELYTQARVKLSANLSSLEQVWVLFP